jgi:hypothetical protein
MAFLSPSSVKIHEPPIFAPPSSSACLYTHFVDLCNIIDMLEAVKIFVHRTWVNATSRSLLATASNSLSQQHHIQFGFKPAEAD